MTDIIPLFYDHSSRRSLLTYWGEKDVTPEGPQSIISLCKRAGLQQCFGVSTNFHTFLEAWKGLKEVGIQFCFGLEMTLCEDAKDHTPESQKTEHKIIIFAKNSNGYCDLIKIFTACHSDISNKYYIQRFDCKQLKPLWTDNLLLTVPFFDSFIHKNSLIYGANIVPDFPVKPMMFREVDSGVPLAEVINPALDNYIQLSQSQEIRTKTVFYEKRQDLAAYITFRAIQGDGTFSAPRLDFMCSPKFCFEDWELLNQ